MKKRLLSLLLTAALLLGLLPPTAIPSQAADDTCTHAYTSTVTAPTCVEQGYTTHTCTLCGHSYTDDYTEGTGHSFTEWYETKEATFDESGEEARDCTKCSHYETREVPLTVITSGNFGAGTEPTDAVTYTLYSNGTMVVEGQGPTYYCNWDASKQPFIEYRDQVKQLVIGEGITVINRGSFAYLSNLETVSLPSTVTSLSGNCFMSSFIKEVNRFTIPASVTSVGVTILGSNSGDTFFTDIVIENPNIEFPPTSNSFYHAVFNHGRKPERVTLYSYGTENNVSAYAQAIGCKYIDLNNYLQGTADGIRYSYHDGTLTLEALAPDAVIPVTGQPWAQYRSSIETIILMPGITTIPANAFRDYAALNTVELPFDLKQIGDGAFAIAALTDSVLSINIPRRIEFLGSDLFSGRTRVNVSAYYGSMGEHIQGEEINLLLKHQFNVLMIGNSFTNDAANCSQGMKDSQLFNMLQELLGEDAEITLGVITSGGKTMAWHATQAEQGNRKYSFNIVTSKDGKWASMGSASSAEALAWMDWDAVILQPYQVNTRTGNEIVPYPEETDEKYSSLESAAAYMLDHVAKYAPYAEAYCYMHWATGSTIALNAGLSTYNNYAAFYPEVLNYTGFESKKQFRNIIPVGLSIQNARTTYLALLKFNTSAEELTLWTDTQIGLMRDGAHVSFNIGRYIAGLTVAETIIPEEMRAEGYVLPDIRITESIGQLPKEYTVIAQKAVHAAVESWKNGSLEVTTIEGYLEDPTVATKQTLSQATFDVIHAADVETLKERICAAVLATLPEDFAVDAVALPEDFSLSLAQQSCTADVTLRFGYTSVQVTLTLPVQGYIAGDINGDGLVNNKDVTRLFRYLSDYDVEVVEEALDVNGDDQINNKDLTRLFQYLSDYEVEIF